MINLLKVIVDLVAKCCKCCKQEEESINIIDEIELDIYVINKNNITPPMTDDKDIINNSINNSISSDYCYVNMSDIENLVDSYNINGTQSVYIKEYI